MINIPCSNVTCNYISYHNANEINIYIKKTNPITLLNCKKKTHSITPIMTTLHIYGVTYTTMPHYDIQINP